MAQGKFLVTGSAGHLGEALVRTLRSAGIDVRGIDRKASEFTDHVGSIVDPEVATAAVAGCDTVLHTATLHKPHIVSHTDQDFIDVNVSGTRNLLAAAQASGVRAFVFTSTTSTFGDALRPPPGEPASWITESVMPLAKNIYGATKIAAEDLCRIYQRNEGLPVVVLRTSRFFPERDDDPERAGSYSGVNLKLNEFLYRRVDIEDVVSAHLLAAERAPDLGFAKYIISATTPFQQSDCAELDRAPMDVVARYVPDVRERFAALGFRMLDRFDRVYVNAAARNELGWAPKHSFESVLAQLQRGEAPGSDLSRAIGVKGYHDDRVVELDP